MTGFLEQARFAPKNSNGIARGGPDMGKFGDWLGGNGQRPGIFGGGQYAPDESKFQLPGLAQAQGFAQQNAQNALGAAAPMVDQGQADQFRGQQSQLAGMLMQGAQGNGPSAAQGLLQQQTQNNIANAYAMAQANPNNAGAARNIANQAAMANQQAAGQGAIMRAQEQQAAQGQLGGLLSGARGQDLGVAGQNAQLAQNQFQLGNQAALGWSGQQLGANEAQLRANLAEQQMKANAYANAQAGGRQLLGGTLSAGSALLGGLAQGGLVFGHAAYGGDSYANDTVPAMLSPGEVVLPRSVVQSEDAPEKAKAFLEAIKRKHRRAA